FNEMAKSLHEKEKIKRAFSSYVARQVVDEILKHPDEYTFTGERRNVTVIFCDMRGFTPLTERLPPEEVVAALNDFYSLMIDLTIKNEGYLNKFLGDAVMAIFGAPTAYPDHCMKAVKTALAMQAAVAELSARRVAEGKEAMSIGIGISAGEAVAGSVGTEFQTEYTVIGDRVNLAARLESNAKPGQILVSEETYRQVADKVIANCLGPMSVKGKEEPVTVFEISGLAAYTRGRDEAAQKIPVAKAGGAGRGGGLSRRLRRGDANSDHAGGGRQIRLREFRIAGLLRGDRQGGRHGGEPGRALSRRQEPGLDDRRLRRRRADCAGPPGGDPEKTVESLRGDGERLPARARALLPQSRAASEGAHDSRRQGVRRADALSQGQRFSRDQSQAVRRVCLAQAPAAAEERAADLRRRLPLVSAIRLSRPQGARLYGDAFCLHRLSRRRRQRFFLGRSQKARGRRLRRPGPLEEPRRYGARGQRVGGRIRAAAGNGADSAEGAVPEKSRL